MKIITTFVWAERGGSKRSLWHKQDQIETFRIPAVTILSSNGTKMIQVFKDKPLRGIEIAPNSNAWKTIKVGTAHPAEELNHTKKKTHVDAILAKVHLDLHFWTKRMQKIAPKHKTVWRSVHGVNPACKWKRMLENLTRWRTKKQNLLWLGLTWRDNCCGARIQDYSSALVDHIAKEPCLFGIPHKFFVETNVCQAGLNKPKNLKWTCTAVKMTVNAKTTGKPWHTFCPLSTWYHTEVPPKSTWKSV